MWIWNFGLWISPGFSKNIMTYDYPTKDRQSCKAIAESNANALKFDRISQLGWYPIKMG